MALKERAEVDVEELVAVERVHRAGPMPPLRRVAQPPAAAERLGLADGHDVRADARKRDLEPLFLARTTGDEDAVDTGVREAADLVLDDRATRDLDEGLRQASGGVPEALGLAAREDQRLH